MLQSRPSRLLLPSLILGRRPLFLSNRAFSGFYVNESEEADLDAARKWYQRFTNSKSMIPANIAKTTFSRSSGPGGQKTNKTSSKATTHWPVQALALHVPKFLHRGLRGSRYYVSSSDSITIQCDSHRGQTENEEENHRRLYDEISKIYKQKIPGVTSQETKQKHEAFQKAGNALRLKTKKMHSDKKRSRSGGGDF